MTKRERELCVRFYRFCAGHKLQPEDVAELVRLSDRAFRAGERECNVKDFNADLERSLVERKAEEMGLTVCWPGLAPLFGKGQNEFHLPG